MSDTHAPDGAGTGEPPTDPAVARTRELLALVATHAPAEPEGFAQRVVLRARRQQAVARPLRAIGEVVVAVLGAARALLSTRPEPR